MRSRAFRRAGLALGLTAAVFLYLMCFRRCLIDDAFITMTYARNLRDHATWGLIPGRTANTATSPLNVLALAAVSCVVRNMRYAAIVLTAAEFVSLWFLLLGIARRIFGGPFFAVAVFCALLGSPLLMSTIGLESSLCVTLLVASLYLFLLGRWRLLATALGLLTLARPDGLLAFLVFFLFVHPAHPDTDGSASAWRAHVAVRALFTGIYALTLAPWLLFAWLHLGSFVPDTLLIKTSQGAWGPYKFGSGLWIYWEHSPAETLFSFILLPGVLCFAAFFRNRRALATAGMLLLFDAAYYAAYTHMAVPPYHWYYVPIMASSVLIAVLGLAAAYEACASPSLRWVRRILWIAPVLGFAGVPLHFARYGTLSPPEAPIHTNWATWRDYRRIGRWVEKHTEPTDVIRFDGEIGTLAFYSSRALLDPFSDRLLIRNLIFKAGTRSDLLGALARFNFRHLRDTPPIGAPSYRLEHVHGVRLGIADLTVDSSDVVKIGYTSSRWVPESTIVLVRRR